MASSKQYNARYGLRPRKKIDKILSLRENATKCPYCMKKAVKRVSAGIWYCESCFVKFTGGAYTFDRKHYKQTVVEAEFLKPKSTDKDAGESLEGFDEEQEVEF